jgi:hypothetical protein
LIFEITFGAASRGAQVGPFSLWPQEQELLFPPYTFLTFNATENRGRKRFIKLGASISTNRPSLDGLDLDHCSSMPPWRNEAKEAQQQLQQQEEEEEEEEERAAMQHQVPPPPPIRRVVALHPSRK